MTREEKLKRLADNMFLAAQYLKDDASRLHKAMEEYHHFVVYEYSKMEGEHRWISVKESLPPINEEVIVLANRIRNKELVSANRICSAHIVDKGLAMDAWDGWNIPGVHHWMPMPEIPKKEENEMKEDKEILDFIIGYFKSEIEHTKYRMLDSLTAQIEYKPHLEQCKKALAWLEKQKEEKR